MNRVKSQHVIDMFSSDNYPHANDEHPRIVLCDLLYTKRGG